MAEKRDIEINSRADTIDLMNPEIRPWPVTPAPSFEEVMEKTYAKRKAEDFGRWCEDNLRYEYCFGKPEALQGMTVLSVVGHVENGQQVLWRTALRSRGRGDQRGASRRRPLEKAHPLRSGKSTCSKARLPAKNAGSTFSTK